MKEVRKHTVTSFHNVPWRGELFVLVILAKTWILWLFSLVRRCFLQLEKVEVFVIREFTFQMKVYSRTTNFFSSLFTALKQLQTVSCSNIIGSDKMLLLRHLKLPIGGVVWPFGWTKINFAKALGQENATGDSRLQEGWWLTLLHYDWIRENNALD